MYHKCSYLQVNLLKIHAKTEPLNVYRILAKLYKLLKNNKLIDRGVSYAKSLL